MTLLFMAFSFLGQAQFFSQVVGVVEGEAVTSREIELQFLVDRVAFSEKAPKNIRNLNIAKKTFAEEVNSTLVEIAVEKEAKAFSVAQVDRRRVDAMTTIFLKRIKGNMRWRYLDYSVSEVKLVIERKLRARRFLDFKKDSTIVPITDKEAKAYFDSNRLRFGTLPFERFQANIKRFLGTRKLNSRLREWFELLKKKYKIRNLLEERVSRYA